MGKPSVKRRPRAAICLAAATGWFAVATACSGGVSPRAPREGSAELEPVGSPAPSQPSQAVAAAAPVTAAPAVRAHERYDHGDALALVQGSDAVIAPTPPVHPVHTVYNREAIVPPMCYTRTEGTHNPCYVCHQDSVKGRPNAMDDGDLQREYSFSDMALTNRWKNLFEDRSARVAAISDDEIVSWVGQDNYSELAPRLRDAGFRGYIPDLENLQLGAAAFDDQGFAKDGSHWVAFNYKPMPSTFWPTNGSTDDVMIRLPSHFRETVEGEFSKEVYRANLALVEANIKGLSSISIAPVDESALDEDLDGDGELRVATRIVGIDERKMYVGGARKVPRMPWLFPFDTEFLHSVRYVGVDADGNVFNPPRLKELRYMRKRWAFSVPQLFEAYQQEHSEKEAGQLPGYIDRGPHGFDNGMGWVIAGFIENKSGRLRANTYEENLFCMGCHTSIGTTIDSTFSFARKIDGATGWGYINLRGMPDAPNRGERIGEIATYLRRAGGGGEFRSNPEMQTRWFRKDGTVARRRVARARDVYELIAPSRRRALDLNKAYRLIVEDQDFLYGRDATAAPPVNVYDVVDNERVPTLPPERTYSWDIRLDWGRAANR